VKRLVIFLLVIMGSLSAVQESDLKIRHLKNGMTVYLKAFENDDNTVSFQITSKRGYDSFGKEKRAALLLAPDVVTESGISLLDGDALSSLLYDYSIELYYSVDDHYSFILAETFPVSSAKLLEVMQSFLMLPKWNREALAKVKGIAQKQLAADDKDPFTILQREHYRLNNVSVQPITEKEILDVSLEDVQSAFALLFGDPRDLSLIIAGSFNEQEIMQMVENTLEKIPVPEQKTPVKFITPRPFPYKIQTSSLTMKEESDSALLLTFALPQKPDAKTLNSLELLAESIEYGVKNELTSSPFFPSSIEAAIEFPYYPETAGGWLTLVARFKNNGSNNPSASLIQALDAIKKRGFSEKEVSAANQQLSSEDQFWQNEDEFWLSFLGNCYLMGFDPREVLEYRAKRVAITPKEVSQLFNQLDIRLYTELIQRPE
jgi:predicted Zn-dependent peptidase